MKKLFFTAVILLAPFATFAIDCSIPTTQYEILLGIFGTYYCGYNNEPGTICYYQAVNGGMYATGCNANINAPINGGLVFLIIAGIALGAYMMRKYKNAVQAA